MASRTSIELLPTGSRLVEVELPRGRRGAAAPEVRVRAWASPLPEGEDADGLIASLTAMRVQRKLAKHAWVTIWGLRSVQQLHKLPPASPAALEALAIRESKKEIITLEANGERACVGIVLGDEIQVGSHRRREVSLVAVSAAEVSRRIQPLVDAGFVVDGVSTPSLALTAVARAQRDTTPGSAAVYVAITARATCLAIIRGGMLLFSREMPWGHDATEADAIGAKLASELKRSVLYFKQTFRTPVESVVLCGDMPNLRALTAPLGAELDISVKPLDSLVGIDALTIPEPAEPFRAAVGGLQLAIATGSDPAPPANLLPTTIRISRASRARVTRVGAAIAASLALTTAGYVMVQQSAGNSEVERREVQQELARLEPEAQRLEGLRQVYQLDAARRAALGAFDSQGPRLARVFEVLSASTPEEIVLTSVSAQAAGLHWNTTIQGVAIAADASAGQAAVNTMIDALTASSFVGAPVRPPSIRVVTGTQSSNPSAGGETAARVPGGMSGVEFTLQFEIRK